MNSIDERRFYLFKSGSGDPSDFEFVNESEALVDGRQYLGIHKVSVPSYSRPLRFGLPDLLAIPKLVLGSRKNELLDIYGLSMQFISDRAKRLLEALDPEAFEFALCEAVDWRGSALEPYWFMRVVRVFDAFDEERSNFVTYRERNPDDPEKDSNPAIVEINSLKVLNDVEMSVHAFYLARYQRSFIVDDVFVKAWIDNNLIGAKFVPLQYLTEKEASLSSLFERNSFTRQQGALR